jgi:hypothetical protein
VHARLLGNSFQKAMQMLNAITFFARAGKKAIGLFSSVPTSVQGAVVGLGGVSVAYVIGPGVVVSSAVFYTVPLIEGYITYAMVYKNLDAICVGVEAAHTLLTTVVMPSLVSACPTQPEPPHK